MSLYKFFIIHPLVMVYAMAAMLACPLASFPNRVFHSGYRLPSFLPTFAPQLTTANCITLPRCSRQTSSEPANIFIRAPSDFNCSTKPKPKLSSSKSIFVETHRILGFGVCTAMLVTLAFAGESYAGGIESQYETAKTLIAQEPKNALSLPTWAIHVSSVVEWVVAMALVWQYGDKPGYQAWKGLSWGMVPLLGGALCACTWHFFYNAESLEILVAIQAALTVAGNFTMWVAAFRIYESTKGGSKTS